LFDTHFSGFVCGLEANRRTLEKLVGYAHQQGLTPRRVEVEELFGESVRGGGFL